MKALYQAQSAAPYENLATALQYLVIEDKELPHMLGTLRLALNALARHFCRHPSWAGGDPATVFIHLIAFWKAVQHKPSPDWSKPYSSRATLVLPVSASS